MLAERVHREGGRIMWNSFPQMGALLERSLGEHVDLYDAHTEIRDLPAFDYELPLMSQPMMLGIEARSLATELPYLRADATAAFVGTLDLVITVCTSVAHLSGALGQNSWVLLDTNPHWVWQQDREDSAF